MIDVIDAKIEAADDVVSNYAFDLRDRRNARRIADANLHSLVRYDQRCSVSDFDSAELKTLDRASLCGNSAGCRRNFECIKGERLDAALGCDC